VTAPIHERILANANRAVACAGQLGGLEHETLTVVMAIGELFMEHSTWPTTYDAYGDIVRATDVLIRRTEQRLAAAKGEM
jgi:hypothetical protein